MKEIKKATFKQQKPETLNKGKYQMRREVENFSESDSSDSLADKKNKEDSESSSSSDNDAI